MRFMMLMIPKGYEKAAPTAVPDAKAVYLVFNEGYSATAGEDWVRPELCEDVLRVAEDTDWSRIVALYDALAQLAPSSVVELNRAVAVSMAFGPAAGFEEACVEFERAASLTRNGREQKLLLERAAACADRS